ncbi:PepSY domain-containing protein [Candidatus Woesearchaeota archaeon]|nr:PepSY domain-containing protein [Candidatus Woesearchaeota archaeon]
MEKTNLKKALRVGLGFLIVVVLILGALLVAAVVSDSAPGLGLFSQQASTPRGAGNALGMISGQKAASLALSVASGKVSEITLEKKNKIDIYSVEIEDGESETEVIVDAATGKILKVEKEDEIGKKELEVVNPKITEPQAVKIALQAFKGNPAGVEYKKINGAYFYEVEVQKSGKEADVLVDMMTGKVWGIDVEDREGDNGDDQDEDDDDDDDDDGNAEGEDDTSGEDDGFESSTASARGSSITREQAKEIAVREVGGRATDIESKRYDGKDAWEVEISKDGEEADVLVDKSSGAIVNVEWEDEEEDEDDDD